MTGVSHDENDPTSNAPIKYAKVFEVVNAPAAVFEPLSRSSRTSLSTTPKVNRPNPWATAAANMTIAIVVMTVDLGIGDFGAGSDGIGSFVAAAEPMIVVKLSDPAHGGFHRSSDHLVDYAPYASDAP